MDIKKKKRILVVHPGTQHSTKLTAAIKKSGNEVKLITTVYYKKHTFLHFLLFLLPKQEKKRIMARLNKDLNENDVVVFSEILGLVLLLLARIDKKKKIYVRLKRFVALHVGKKAAKYAINNKYDVLISFDSYALYPFRYLEKHKSDIIKVMDCSAAYAPYARSVYRKVIKEYPNQKDILMSERCVIWNREYYEDMVAEAQIADEIICASNYSKKTLTTYGIGKENIYVIPYGYDCNENNKKNQINYNSFSILYVGNVSVMKGIPNLINAFKHINDNSIELLLVGNFSKFICDMAKDDHRIKVIGFVPHNELCAIYSKADLFVFPSLSDGFGFAPLEAMSYSVPCIVSRESGIVDAIVDGSNGFIINSYSIEEIKTTIEWCISHKSKLTIIGSQSKKTALSYSNDEYVKKIGNFIERL